MILFCFKSYENGNCLFSTFSIAISADNKYVYDLRILESIELYLNSEFYVKQSSFVKVMNSHSDVFNVDTFLALSVWHGAVDSGKTKMELVKVNLFYIVSQINALCNVTSNDKLYSSSYSKVFSKSIAAYVEYSSFKTEDPFPGD